MVVYSKLDGISEKDKAIRLEVTLGANRNIIEYPSPCLKDLPY